jgi:hypothetical protein
MRKHRAIRQKPQTSFPFLSQGDHLRREDALAQAQVLLARSPVHPDAVRLIQLFHITPEELAEAGLPYETLKALDRKACFL